jgi:intracellular multiplication protein IcmP
VAQQQDGKDHNLPIYVVIMMIFMGLIIWFRLRAMIVYPFFELDRIIYYVAGIFGLSTYSQSCLAYIQSVFSDPSVMPTMKFKVFMEIQEDAGSLIKFISAIILSMMVAFIFLRAPEETLVRKFIFRGGKYGFKTHLFNKSAPSFIADLPLPGKKSLPGFVGSGKDFLTYQAEFWRSSVTMAYFDQYQGDPTWRPSDNELDVALAIGVKSVSSIETPKLIERYLQQQLTKHWEGIRKAPIQCQAIAALVVLNRQRNLKKVADLAGDLAMCAIPHRDPDFKAMEALIKPILTDKVVAVLDQVGAKHGFLKTAMIGIYGYGGPFREWGGGRAGTLQPAIFLWLKGVDREMWYALQCVGRQSYFAEACAAVSHFKYERMIGKPVKVAYIKAAVSGFVNTLKLMKIEDVAEYHASLMDNMM